MSPIELAFLLVPRVRGAVGVMELPDDRLLEGTSQAKGGPSKSCPVMTLGLAIGDDAVKGHEAAAYFL